MEAFNNLKTFSNRGLFYSIMFTSFLAAGLFLIISFQPGKALACSGNDAVYFSNQVAFAVYLSVRNKPVTREDVTTFIKIASPARYIHDRYNVFLWKKLYREDSVKLNKLISYVKTVKCFKEYINAGISGYDFHMKGFYLTYHNSGDVIENGMRTHRNIDFIKFKHSNIYYLFHNLTVTFENAGDFNFINVPEKKAENFLNGRTGVFGQVGKSIFLVYYFVPVSSKGDVLTVKVVRLKAYSGKDTNFMVGTIDRAVSPCSRN